MCSSEGRILVWLKHSLINQSTLFLRLSLIGSSRLHELAPHDCKFATQWLHARGDKEVVASLQFAMETWCNRFGMTGRIVRTCGPAFPSEPNNIATAVWCQRRSGNRSTSNLAHLKGSLKKKTPRCITTSWEDPRDMGPGRGVLHGKLFSHSHLDVQRVSGWAVFIHWVLVTGWRIE